MTEIKTIALIMPNRDEKVYEGKACPLCGCRTFAFERHDIRAFISDTQSYSVVEDPQGDTFNLMCECGLEFSMHVDDLWDRLYAGKTTTEMDLICETDEKSNEALIQKFIDTWSERI